MKEMNYRTVDVSMQRYESGAEGQNYCLSNKPLFCNNVGLHKKLEMSEAEKRSVCYLCFWTNIFMPTNLSPSCFWFTDFSFPLFASVAIPTFQIGHSMRK